MLTVPLICGCAPHFRRLAEGLSLDDAAPPYHTRSYFVHGLNNVILVSVLLLDISIKSGGYSESFFNPAASLFLN